MSERMDSNQFYDFADQLIKEKRYDEAIELYEKMRKMNPGDDSLCMSLAWAYKDSGRTDEAMVCWEELFEKELKQKVFTGFAFDELVKLYRDTGNYDKLVELCEKVVAVQPRDIALLSTLGDSCIRAGNADRAIEVFKKLIEMDPESSMSYCRLGDAQIIAGNFDKAEEYYDTAIKTEPSGAHTFYNKMSNTYIQTGQYDKAEKALQKAIESQPDQPFYYCNLGEVYVMLKELDKAEAAYENAIRIHPDSEGAFYNRLGNTLAKENHYKKAIEIYKKAIKVSPENHFYFLSLAESYRAEGLFDKASEAVEISKALKDARS